MCGIFGIITSSNHNYSKKFLSKSFTKLAILAESRGKDSSGVSILNKNRNFNILKGSVPISELIKNKNFKELLHKSYYDRSHNNFLMGHARLVTNGTQLSDDNNQPVIKNGTICIHNGIITNIYDLWTKYAEFEREFEIDTEIVPLLFNKYIQENKPFSQFFKEIEGSAALALNFSDYNKLFLATNFGCIYTLHNSKDFFLFASENSMIDKMQRYIGKLIKNSVVEKIEIGRGVVVDYEKIEFHNLSLDQSIEIFSDRHKCKPYKINLIHSSGIENQLSVVNELNFLHLEPEAKKEKKLLQYPLEKIKLLRRCSRCILPETFPFITFDRDGLCNYCSEYKMYSASHSKQELCDYLSSYKKYDQSPDVLLPISGGRDSTYTLHYVKKELGMNPITYTYDWGMVTDLARRNIARVCGELGVENIIVAADIHWKRKNIKKNIIAWLKNPELGMIPLFMSGDKYFFYYAYKIKKELNIDIEVWGINRLENTDFKTGFAGLPPEGDKKYNFSLSFMNHLKLLNFVGLNYLRSPGYFNQSMFDTFGSFLSRYITPKNNFISFFEYVKWDEKVINDTIINQYGWETAVDTNSTWRIGDGTASFYNYIYNIVSGFSEHDTFRSNQIREGMITRQEAMEHIYSENHPRYNSLKWYLEIIGLDYNDTITKINKIPRLY